MSNDPFLGRLRVLDVCDLSDAIDALGMTPAVTGLVLTSGARPIAGRAITVRIGAGDAAGNRCVDQRDAVFGQDPGEFTGAGRFRRGHVDDDAPGGE